MNNTTQSLYHSLEVAVHALFGTDAKITQTGRVHGGDINDAFRLRLSTGETVFAKTNSIKNADFFIKESHGLPALGRSGVIGVPKALGAGIDKEKGISFLLLEFIESAPRGKDYWETFGHELAMLHRTDASGFSGPEKYGFFENNYIGASPQKNLPMTSWTDFYRECRLIPQFRMAEHYFDSSLNRKAAYLLEHLDSCLREPEFPSLLHGDLWSGNVLCGKDGKAWILDPAVYVGDFETDLAMTQLFGSFPARFYSAYNEITPIDKGYEERKDLYHLYHLLNHLNLFGRTYLGSVAAIINAYV